jgi:hypothetical protein
MKAFPQVLLLASTLFLSLFLGSCGGSGDDERSLAPTLTILSPKDTLLLSDKVPVEILFNDNSGLVSTEITIGNVDQGNLVYHYSQRGLSGTSDDLSFDADVPPVVEASGENYIIVEVIDEDGNETFVEGSFFILSEDVQDPIINSIMHQGTLSTDPQNSMSVDYSLSDNQGLENLELLFMESFNGNLTGDTIFMRNVALNGIKSIQGSESVTGSPSYPNGIDYKVLAKVTDLAGNSAIYLSTNEYTVAN